MNDLEKNEVRIEDSDLWREFVCLTEADFGIAGSLARSSRLGGFLAKILMFSEAPDNPGGVAPSGVTIANENHYSSSIRSVPKLFVYSKSDWRLDST